MRRIKSRNTKPEIIVRRLVHSMGIRYRIHRRDLPGKPDLVFGPRKKVIFVHGCFWHQHPVENCLDGRKPKSNNEYWNSKLQRNVERDKQVQLKLWKLGWQTMTVWECETIEIELLQTKLHDFLD